MQVCIIAFLFFLSYHGLLLCLLSRFYVPRTVFACLPARSSGPLRSSLVHYLLYRVKLKYCNSVTGETFLIFWIKKDFLFLTFIFIFSNKPMAMESKSVSVLILGPWWITIFFRHKFSTLTAVRWLRSSIVLQLFDRCFDKRVLSIRTLYVLCYRAHMHMQMLHFV